MNTLIYYKVDRAEEKYVISLYYKKFWGMKELHRSVHTEVKSVNQVVQYYRSKGYMVQSIRTA